MWIYLITNKINNKKYVGLTTNSIEIRWTQHKSASLNIENNTPFYKALRKYGIENFTVESVAETSSKEELCKLEQKFIKELDTLNPKGYNLTIGGEFTEFCTETKKQMSDFQKVRQQYMSSEEKQIQTAGIKKYIENKKRPLVAVHIEQYSVVHFKNSTDSINNIKPKLAYSNLRRKDLHSQRYMWFDLEDGKEDSWYIEETKKILQERGYAGKSKTFTFQKDPEKRAQRIQAQIEGSAWRADAIVGISRFDGSMLEFPSLNQANKAGFIANSIWHSLRGLYKHAHNYAWFYKEEGKEQSYYLELAKDKLGSLFCDLNIKPLIATHKKTGEVFEFINLFAVAEKGFNKKYVRACLLGRCETAQGYYWKVKE